MTLHSVRSSSGYYTTFSLVRKVTYHRRSFTKAQEAVPPRTLKMLEHAKGDYFITLGSKPSRSQPRRRMLTVCLTPLRTS